MNKLYTFALVAGALALVSAVVVSSAGTTTRPATIPAASQPATNPAATLATTQAATQTGVRVILSGVPSEASPSVDPRAPIDGRVLPTGPSATISSLPNGAPANKTGQALTNTFPPGDRFQVFKDNHWINAQVLQRAGGRALVRFDGYPESANEWVSPSQVR